MKKILLTGLSKKEFVKKVKKMEDMGCYFCKRTEKDGTVFFNKHGVGCTDLKINLVSTKFKGLLFDFSLCHECIIAFQGIAELTAGKEEKAQNKMRSEQGLNRISTN